MALRVIRWAGLMVLAVPLAVAAQAPARVPPSAEVEPIIQRQLGSMLWQLAQYQVEIDRLRTEVARLRAELAKLKPDMKESP